MNLRRYILLVLTLVVFCGCEEKSFDIKNGEIRGDIFSGQKEGLLIKRSLARDTTLTLNEMGFIVPENEKPCLVSELITNPNRSRVKDVYELSVIIDKSNTDSIDLHLDWMNTLLDTMKVGFNIGSEIDLIELDKLDSLNTEGRINTDNIIRQLDTFLLEGSDKRVENLNKIVVLLLRDSQFFNTANAIAINHKDKHFIFGDLDLLQTPMIVLHELGHAFQLTHANSATDSCSTMFNIMHESNIGCTKGFSARQLAIMASGKYVQKCQEYYYPDTEDCACADHYSSLMNNDVEEYLNSIDRNIDDTPLVGNHDLLRSEIEDNFDKHDEAFEDNYEEEYERFFGLPVDNHYVKNRLNSHKKLRRNNLNRWLIHNRESLGLGTINMGALKDSSFADLRIEEYKNILNARSFCNENDNSCSSKLACLRKESLALKENETKLKNAIRQLKAINVENSNSIEVLNNEIGELLVKIRNMNEDGQPNQELEIIEGQIRKIKYGTAKSFKDKN